MRLRAVWPGLLATSILVACTVLTDQPDPSPPAPTCPASQITFTQEEGCTNDGSVEFCIPADDPGALAAVQDIASSVECMGSRGRAGCDLDTEILCLVEVRDHCLSDRASPRGLDDAGWDMVCELAGLPFVREIVPTWYE
jgi:hypothetical protein